MQDDNSPLGSESDGMIRNLGADLPDADGTGFASDDNEQQIEVRQPPKAFAVIDKRKSVPSISATRKSTGKLTRPTRPSERHVPAPRLAPSAPHGQRKLQGPARDPMAFNESPRPILPPRAAQPAQFSPTRKRKRQVEADQQAAAETVVVRDVQGESRESDQEADAAPGADDREGSVGSEAIAQEPPQRRQRQRREKGHASRRSTRLHPIDEKVGHEQVESAARVEDVPRLKPGPVANRHSLYPEGNTSVEAVEVEEQDSQKAQTTQRAHAGKARVVRKEKPRRTRPEEQTNGGAQGQSSNRAMAGTARGSGRSEGSKSSQISRDAARPGTGSSNSAATEDETMVDERDDTLRLYDQESRLKDIYLALKDIGWSHCEGEQHKRTEIDLADPEVIRLKELCVNARKKLEQPASRSSDRLPCMDELGLIEDGLLDLDNDQAYFNSRTKMTNMYFYLVPNLVKLLRGVIRYFQAKDNLASTRSSIEIDNVRFIVQVMRPIVNLKGTLEKYPKPVGLNMRLPVRNDVLLPLNQVRIALQGVVATHNRREELARQRTQDAILAAEREQRWVEEAEEARRRQYQKKKWQQLHLQRRDAEYIIDSVAKLDHLAVPPLVDIDHNGEPFERIALFTSRVGPPPSKTTAARAKIRPEHELAALEAGLKAYAGPRVYQDIFETYCVQHGVLTDWSVTEIVTLAADIVAVEKREQMKEQGYVEDWVEQIPLWTAPHPDLVEQGQENRAGVEEEDEWIEV
ncbi:uncharacterized protein MYCGRDRAFT_107288 [Zymoseptoria tritici IPO323]|uniref:Uncharacterized protein n=1 Tax=Zymoseptoria tritici (strain CBS 115943 / IPO323) TaxID=336722 RepID=F9WWK4_ZYMTI|nr:uncharacterized protein MYCGRDRAFT_107288 [Zymoseptoria tritici IPO323]EGP91335.1 hypothetical protein MYCGRDRAFT_107288 [Zymoseptoria tritici IPO323]